MFKSVYRSLCAVFITVALCILAANGAANGAAPGNIGLAKNPVRQDKDKDKDKKDKKAAEQQTKQEREYQKIKQFSENLYNTDPSFRQEVEDAYRQKQKEHSELAYFTNTRDSRDDQITRTGDKLKVDDALYDNPLVQDYVNRVGQSIVPKDSKYLYAFKVTLNPIPEARALSTGTVYISSGMLSKIDNEAQLAYILGHEVAHVEKNHWREDVIVERGLRRYNESQEKKRKLIGGLISMGAGAAVGGATGSFTNGVSTAYFLEQGLPSIIKLAVPDAVVSWDKGQEDEADQMGLKYMFDRNYDPREVPKFYAALDRTSRSDPRAGLGFMADPARMIERVQQVNTVISSFGNISSGMQVGALNLNMMQQQAQLQAQMANIGKEKEQDKGKGLGMGADSGRTVIQLMASGAMTPEIRAKIEAGDLIGSSAEFATVMAELKRDNGLRAFYYDMFKDARASLEESLLIRSNDPFTHLYYGKVLKLTARNSAEKQRALSEFVKAIDLDKRRVVAEPHLYRALALIETRDPAQSKEIVSSLQEYVTVYQREHGGSLPDNMDIIYDYMQETGEMEWAARPALNVSTKNIDPIGIQTSAATSSSSQVSTPVIAPTTSTPATDTPVTPSRTNTKRRP
jgi:predicted Zn-dependent protease